MKVESGRMDWRKSIGFASHTNCRDQDNEIRKEETGQASEFKL